MTTQAQIKEKNKLEKYKKSRKTYKSETGITIVTLVITIVLNCSYLAMERMLKEVKILKKDETSCII